MKNVRAQKRFTLRGASGFTLIELLVVIGVLGILAAGLLATVNPLEQFRKGQDANRKSAAAELTNAVSRYNAARGEFPWGPVPDGADCNAGNPPASTVPDTGGAFETCYDALEGQGEIKTSFRNSNVLDDLLLTERADGTVAVCFLPESLSVQENQVETRYDVDGDDAGGACTPGTDCYWCAR